MPTATTTADKISIGPDGTDDIEVDIAIACSEWERAVPGLQDLCRTAITAALGAGVAVRPSDMQVIHAAEVSLVLADDAFIRDLNHRYRNIDRPTNVLAFPNALVSDEASSAATGADAGAPMLLGDVIVAYETAAGEAGAEKKSLADHLCHLIVHGTLHLLGHDHQQDEEAEKMESLEIKALTVLGITNPYAEPS